MLSTNATSMQQIISYQANMNTKIVMSTAGMHDNPATQMPYIYVNPKVNEIDKCFQVAHFTF